MSPNNNASNEYDRSTLVSPQILPSCESAASFSNLKVKIHAITTDTSGSFYPPTTSIVTSSKSTSIFNVLFPPISLLLWPSLLTVPLLLSGTSENGPTHYSKLFPTEWYDTPSAYAPKPLGLILGIVAVAVGQAFVILYHFIRIQFGTAQNVSIQRKGARNYDFWEGVRTQLCNPEGFGLLIFYLSGTWMGGIMPAAYYSFEGGIDYWKLTGCLVIQDFVQYVMHRLEHVVSPGVYKRSHEPHHRFTNPRLFDAFNGSPPDTILMILIPLYITAWTIPCNVWTYMAFGSMYANWLTLIHSEFPHVWDKAFRTLGLGTPGDHHVHHKFFKYNFGHLFMWSDMIFKTHRYPENFLKVFNKEV